MPRRRTLNPEFFKDEDLACLPFEARLLFQGLWCYADRSGRLEDRPKYLKAEIFPYDRVDVEKLLSLLASPNLSDRPTKVFIRRYGVDDRQYIEIIEFVKHQHPHVTEPDSKYPPYNVQNTCDNVQNTFQHVGIGTDASVTLPMTNDQRPMTNDQKGKKPKRPYGEFTNVLLTDHEHAKLETKFGPSDTTAKIENMSRYLASKGDKYKSHYATILNWAEKDKKAAPSEVDDLPPECHRIVRNEDYWICGCEKADTINACRSRHHGMTLEESYAYDDAHGVGV